MLQSVLVGQDFEERECVKDCNERWICEGMYVNEVNCDSSSQRQGWVTEVIDEVEGTGKIKVKIVCKAGDFLDEQSSYITEFEESTNWSKALVSM